MSLLIAASGAALLAPDGTPGPDLAAALQSAARQGFGSTPQRVDWPGGAAWWFATPGGHAGSGACVRQGPRFALAVGSFHWQGRGPEASLRALLALDTPVEQLPWAQFSGGFTLLLGREDGVWLLGDAVGLQKAYARQPAVGGGAPGLLVSSSLLACVAGQARLQVQPLAAQQFVLFGAVHGLQTPLQGVRLIDPTQALDLADPGLRRAVTVHPPAGWRATEAPGHRDEAVRLVGTRLAQEFEHLVQAHGRDIGMALSGGFDSRLLLAALDHLGVKPTLYVYGRPQDEDVTVAQAVAARAGIPIVATDKSRERQDWPALDTARLRHNLRFGDGLPLDGAFDRGPDEATRRAQLHQGRLNLNGGGGEILRNFFYLRDGGYSAQQVVDTFWSGWLPAVFGSADERQAFVDALADTLLQALGRPHGSAAARAQPLARAEVELLYTLVRLRFWMGANNSLMTRHGRFMTPLVTPGLAALGAALPLRWKDHGALEAAVITRLSPRVAAGPSAYGFAFDRGPGLAQRAKAQGTLWRPVRLRARSVQLQVRLGRLAPPQVPAEWRQALGEAEACGWIRAEALTAADQWARLMTVQALLACPADQR